MASRRVVASVLCIALLPFAVLPANNTYSVQGSNPTECYMRILSPAGAATEELEQVELLTALVEICADYGRRDDAIRFLARAIEVGRVNTPDPPLPTEKQTILTSGLENKARRIARLVIAACVKLHLYDQALSIISKIYESGERAWLLTGLARSMSDEGLKDQSRSTLSRAYDTIRSSRDEGALLSFIARAYAAIGDLDTAEGLAAKITNPISDFLKLQTMAYIAIEIGRAGQHAKAKTLISRTLQATLQMKPYDRTDESKAEILSLLADAYLELGSKDDATELLTRAEDRSKRSKYGLAIEEVVASYARMGETAKARSLTNGMQYLPSKADSLIEIARGHFRAGDAKLGAEALEESLNLSKEIIRANDTFKTQRLISIAAEYAQSGQPQRASDVLIYALDEEWRSEPRSNDNMLDTAKAYARLGLTLDDQACGLLKKIVDREPVPLTADESRKRVLSEQAADQFIKRWHETLDLNVLFGELYVSNAKQRQANAYLFYGVYRFLTMSDVGPAVDKNVDEILMRRAFFAFWNTAYLRNEYRLAYQESQEDELKEPREFASTIARQRRVKLNSKRIVRAQVEQFISESNRTAAVYRKYLTTVFNSLRYLANLKEEEARSDGYRKRFRIRHGFSEFGVPDSTRVYYLRHGVFDFYFIEENGQMKVLTLGFEL